MRYTLNFTRTIKGYIEIEADNLKEAEDKFLNDDYDIFDNYSEEEFEKDEKGELKFVKE